jgi:hypothetical protein
MQYNPSELAFSSLFRNKQFGWTEVLQLTGKTPTEILNISLTNHAYNPPDPLYLLSQSAKNYSSELLTTVIENYDKPKLFLLGLDNYGIATSLNQALKQPIWASHQQNYNWLELSLKLESRLPWLGHIPGVKSICLVGSIPMHIATDNSDIDLIIQCNPYLVLMVRLWVKILLKFWGVDVFSFWLGLKLFRQKSLHKYNSEVLKQIRSYKQRAGVKIDVGLFYETESQLEAYYGRDIRQIWLWKGLQVWPSKSVTSFDLSAKILNNKFYFFQKIFWLVLSGLSVFVYPLSLLQLPFYNLKNGKNPNRPVKFNFVSFYPLYHEDKFLVEYKS